MEAHFIPTKMTIAPAVPISCPGNKNFQYLSPGPPSLNAKSKLPAKQSTDAMGCTYFGLIINCGTACVSPPTMRAMIPMGRSLTAAIIAESWRFPWKNVASRSWAQAIHMNTADAWKMSGKILGKLQISCGSSEYPRGTYCSQTRKAARRKTEMMMGAMKMAESQPLEVA